VLLRLVSALKFIEYPYRVIGIGSNILARDGGFDGVIIRMRSGEIVENGNIIYADAGAPLVSVAARAAELELTGLEFSAGIPGTVGGAVFGNAGAFGSNISDVTVMVDVLKDGEIVSMDNKSCKFAYRTSIFQKKRDIVILGAYFSLKRGDGDKIRAKMGEYLEKRQASQPVGRSAGCTFRNPNAGKNSPFVKGVDAHSADGVFLNVSTGASSRHFVSATTTPLHGYAPGEKYPVIASRCHPFHRKGNYS